MRLKKYKGKVTHVKPKHIFTPCMCWVSEKTLPTLHLDHSAQLRSPHKAAAQSLLRRYAVTGHADPTRNPGSHLSIHIFTSMDNSKLDR